MAISICIDFLLYPDNTSLGTSFVLPGAGGANFGFASGGAALFVNESGGGKGLQFPDKGMKIKLPAPTTRLKMRIGRFASPIQIELIGSGGTVVTTSTVTAVNTYTNKSFAVRKKVVYVVLKGGGNEGILARICGMF